MAAPRKLVPKIGVTQDWCIATLSENWCYGWYSCRARGERKKHESQSQAPTTEPLPERSSPPSSSWAACIKQVYEIDPLECPPPPHGYGGTRKCKGKMRIVAFLQDPVEIKKIMASLGLPDYTAPPPLPKNRAADFEQYCIDEITDEIPAYDTFDA